jgi:ArsR family transcriptional regulator
VPFTPGRPVAEAKADLFKALAHPARIRVLELLSEGDRTVGELAEEVGLELSHLSQQLSVLRRAGIVDSRRTGNSVSCTLRDRDTVELLAVARRILTKNLRDGQQLLAALDGRANESAPRRRTR